MKHEAQSCNRSVRRGDFSLKFSNEIQFVAVYNAFGDLTRDKGSAVTDTSRLPMPR
jgi:hypothetical protein